MEEAIINIYIYIYIYIYIDIYTYFSIMTTVYVLYYYNAEHSTGASWQPEQAHGGVAFAKRLRMRACSLGLVVDEFLLQRDGLHRILEGLLRALMCVRMQHEGL